MTPAHIISSDSNIWLVVLGLILHMLGFFFFGRQMQLLEDLLVPCFWIWFYDLFLFIIIFYTLFLLRVICQNIF